MVYDTPVAKALKVTVDAVADVKLGKASLQLEGAMTFNFDLHSPIGKEKSKVVLNIKGGKVSAK